MQGRSGDPSTTADHVSDAPAPSSSVDTILQREEKAELPETALNDNFPCEEATTQEPFPLQSRSPSRVTSRETPRLELVSFEDEPSLALDPATDLADREVTRSARETPPLPSRAMNATVSSTASWDDPLGDVLDWLGRSDLGKDDRFIPPDGSISGYLVDDLDMLMDPDATFSGHARELFPEAVGIGLPQARAQAPRSRPAKPAKPHLSASSSCPNLPHVCVPASLTQRDLVNEEEQEWVSRQKRTGTVGRLVIYADGDNPQEDILLRGGHDRHLVVAAIRDSGPAAKAGVKAGDRLVSIDGRKDFIGMSADAVRDRLQAPTMLVFLGFVGKLQAEVRLTCADRVCGLSTRHEVVRGYSDAPVQVCEERVFNAGIASLFLACEAELKPPSLVNPFIPMFELQRVEAHDIVRGALSKVAEDSQPPAEYEDGQSQSGHAVRPDIVLGALRKPGGDFGQVEDEQQLPWSPEDPVDCIQPRHPSLEKPVLQERLQGLLSHEAHQQDLQDDLLQWELQQELRLPEKQELAELLLNAEPEPEDFMFEQTF